MAEERLQKILARAGVASRRKAEELIAAGLVTINGRVAVLGDKADAATDAIKVEGRRVPPAVPQRYVLVNKPAGFVSTVVDPEGRPTVLDLVHPSLRKALKPVGRLDFQSEGLLLLTTDGEWAQRIAHPRYGCAKVYEAKVKGVPEERVVERLRRGMWIEGKRTLPAEVEMLRTTARGREAGNSWWEVVLREGRSRQIREMFFRVGHGVLKLRRVAIGPLRDEALPVGGYRELAEGEVEALRKAGRTSAKEQARRGEDAVATASPRPRRRPTRRDAPRPAAANERGTRAAAPRAPRGAVAAGTPGRGAGAKGARGERRAGGAEGGGREASGGGPARRRAPTGAGGRGRNLPGERGERSTAPGPTAPGRGGGARRPPKSAAGSSGPRRGGGGGQRPAKAAPAQPRPAKPRPSGGRPSGGRPSGGRPAQGRPSRGGRPPGRAR